MMTQRKAYNEICDVFEILANYFEISKKVAIDNITSYDSIV